MNRKQENILNMEKLPPIEKIYEAYSALADGRVTISEDAKEAHIASSDGAKHYTVRWEGSHYTSNDSATYWAGYPGYPVLAVWMKQGILPVNEAIAMQFKDVNWNALNKEYKRNYEKAAEAVMNERQMDAAAVRADAEQVYAKLKTLNLTVGRGKGRP